MNSVLYSKTSEKLAIREERHAWQYGQKLGNTDKNSPVPSFLPNFPEKNVDVKNTHAEVVVFYFSHVQTPLL